MYNNNEVQCVVFYGSSIVLPVGCLFFTPFFSFCMDHGEENMESSEWVRSRARDLCTMYVLPNKLGSIKEEETTCVCPCSIE